MKARKIAQINIGEEAQFSKTISEFDVYGIAGIVGDFNPIHVNRQYAETTIFGDRIAHGILGVGLISTVIGIYLPGEGSICLNQSTRFIKPIFIGDTITASVKIIEKYENKNRIKMSTKCINQDGDIVIEGESLIMLPNE